MDYVVVQYYGVSRPHSSFDLEIAVDRIGGETSRRAKQYYTLVSRLSLDVAMKN